MDIHTQLSKNMEEIVQMFQSRMDQFDQTLAQSHGASKTSPQTSSELSVLAADFATFKALMWKSLSMLRQQLELLSAGYDKHEAHSRRKILLFHGLPENDNEEIEDIIRSVLTDKFKLPSINSAAIDICHRLGIKKDKPRPILVHFALVKYKNLVWNSKTVLKGTGVTISEFLTKPRQEVFIAARKHFGIKNCWTSDGAIIILLSDKTRKKIVSAFELQAIIDKHPAQSSNVQEQKQRLRRGLKATK